MRLQEKKGVGIWLMPLGGKAPLLCLTVCALPKTDYKCSSEMSFVYMCVLYVFTSYVEQALKFKYMSVMYSCPHLCSRTIQ